MNRNEIKGKVLFLGDLHLGIKKSSFEFFNNQMKLFEEQIFPYMIKHNIKHIFQYGDFFDHRTSVDIRLLKEIRKRLFDVIVKHDFKLYSLLGNHDIALRESKEYSLIEHFEDLYPNNFVLYKDKTYVDVNGVNMFVIPWLTVNDSITHTELKNVDFVAGHLEIRNFAVVKGHLDETSHLTSDFFKSSFGVKNVFSGHYHIKSTDGLIYYLGTPFALNWNDYDEDKGFYIWDEQQNLEFISNISSKKFVKIKYNDEKRKTKVIEISGLHEKPQFYTMEQFTKELVNLKYHEIKFFVNKSKDASYDEYLYLLKENNISFNMINNQMVTELIEIDYVEESEAIIDNESTRQLITRTIKDNNPNLVPLLNEIFSELDSIMLGE